MLQMPGAVLHVLTQKHTKQKGRKGRKEGRLCEIEGI